MVVIIYDRWTPGSLFSLAKVVQTASFFTLFFYLIGVLIIVLVSF